MQSEQRDLAYLWDMLDAARMIQEFSEGVSYHEYDTDRKLQFAVERGLEILGEAARRVSETFKKAHPEIPWAGIIAQRNVLAHEYGDIKRERIWLVATVRIPDLVPILNSFIPPDFSGSARE